MSDLVPGARVVINDGFSFWDGIEGVVVRAEKDGGGVDGYVMRFEANMPLWDETEEWFRWNDIVEIE